MVFQSKDEGNYSETYHQVQKPGSVMVQVCISALIHTYMMAALMQKKCLHCDSKMTPVLFSTTTRSAHIRKAQLDLSYKHNMWRILKWKNTKIQQPHTAGYLKRSPYDIYLDANKACSNIFGQYFSDNKKKPKSIWYRNLPLCWATLHLQLQSVSKDNIMQPP